MDLSKILTISGKSGLFEVVNQSKTGLVVQTFEGGKKMPVFATDRSSSLEDISLFTSGDDVPLKEVLLKIFDREEGKACPVNTSEPAAMKEYFGEILPEYDRDRVYLSDIKKVLTWYNLLLEKGLITKEEEETEKPDPEAETSKKQEDKPE